MLLRRFKEHAKNHNWFAVGIDFLVITLAILLVFQITECSDRGALRGAQKAALRNMMGESVETVRYLKKDLAAAESRIARQDEAIAALTKKNIGTLTPEEIGNALQSLTLYPAISPPRDVYDTLSGSGDLDLISDRGARREISRYYAMVRFVESETSLARDTALSRQVADPGAIAATYDPQSPNRRHLDVDFRKLSSDAQYLERSVYLLHDQLEFQRYRRELLAQAETMCLVLGQAAKLPCVAYEEETD